MPLLTCSEEIPYIRLQQPPTLSGALLFYPRLGHDIHWASEMVIWSTLTQLEVTGATYA